MMPGSPLALPLDGAFWTAFAAMPASAQYAFAVLLGLVIGSFVNVVAHRLPIMMERTWEAEIAAARGEPEPDTPRYNLWAPRSACPHCGHVLRSWDNLPVFSYLVLRGRCRDCHAPIGWYYPAVEIAGALLAVASLAHFGPHAHALLSFALCATLLALSAIDMRTGLLPDAITLPLLWAGLLANLLGLAFVTLSDAVVGAILGYLFLWSVYWLFRLVRGIEGIGHGDLKLLAALGAWLGWQALPQIILIAAVTGALLGLYAVLRGRMRFEEALPFGPFLATGGLLTLLCGNFLYAI